jgi:hypothetical protein
VRERIAVEFPMWRVRIAEGVRVVLEVVGALPVRDAVRE